MADAPDSKSGRGNPVWVQVPPPAPRNLNTEHFSVPQSAIHHSAPRCRAAELVAHANSLVSGTWTKLERSPFRPEPLGGL